jgi:hypothetical protein
MKLLVITLAFVSFNTQAKPFLNADEADKVAEYLDYICMDTYCGGDFNWTSPSISCDEESCTLEMNAMSWYDDELEITPEEFNSLPTGKKTDENVKLTSADIVESGLYTDKFEGTQISTECEFTLRAPNQTLTYEQKQEMVYSEAADCANNLSYLLSEL